jgi:hypothetical protein
VLTEVREDLEETADVAAEAGDIDQGAKVALEFAQSVYEGGRLLDAASLINRLSKEE